MHIIGQLIAGLIVGVLARLLIPGKEAFPDGAVGWLLTALLGVAGAFVGTIVGGALWGGDNYGAGWIMSILGAIVLLLLVRMVFGKRATV
ncbi:MAG TPA: GlsB/YeaQ/YmgE family stress response membrane protein [Pyrinomonadaceae bacterium]|nr:GlsB/YeaQ/YmgE family stress response membrane protein [Pyrinomonadaceae bacterium]